MLTRLEAEARLHAEEAGRWREEKRGLEEALARAREEMRLVQATRGQAGGSQGQARGSTAKPKQAQQAAATGASMREVRVAAYGRVHARGACSCLRARPCARCV